MWAQLFIVTASWLQVLQPPVPLALDGGPRLADREPVRLERASADIPAETAVLAALPALRRTSALEVGRAWMDVKGVPDTAEQAQIVSRRRLLSLAADDLVPISAMDDALLRNMRLRDHWRGRVWAAPEMAAVIRRASELLAERMPDVKITIGDVAQAGGGQIPFGTRVQLLTDGALRTPVADLLARAHVRFGRVERVETVDPHEAFPVEASRFAEFEDPVLVDTRVTAVSRCQAPTLCPLEARVETRRFWLDKPIEGKRVGRLLAEVRREIKGAKVVARSTEGTGAARVHKAVFVQGTRQVEIIGRRKPGGRLRLSDVIEIRRANLDATKPAVPIRESRYLPEQTPDGTRLVVWRQMYEATHMSHLSGLDADISYVTSGIDYHFTKHISEIDVEASRTWVEIVAEAAADVGASVDRILIDPRVRWRLSRGMSKERKEHPAWGMVRSSRGHDSHLHLRLRPGFAAVAKAPTK